MLYAILIAIIIVLFLLKRYRERFVASYIWQEDQKELSFEPGPDSTGLGNRIFGTSPHTCKKGDELQDGLCYPKCRSGYHGVGPVCWADTVNIGVGKVMLLDSCDDSGHGGYTDSGLLCYNPIKCDPLKWDSCRSKIFGSCVGGLIGGRCRGGELKPKKLSCKRYGDKFPNEIASLCYAKCPEDKPKHVSGMPYLCYKGGPLSYGRGAGTIPPIIKFGN